MTYLILKSCFAGGARRNAGDIVELSAQEANSLTLMGRVEECAAPAKQEPVNRAVALETSTAAPVKKRGRKTNANQAE